MILSGVRLPTSQPIDRPQKGQHRDATRQRSWLDRQRIAAAEPSDDPRVAPPAVGGQFLLFRPRRQLAQEHVRRIRDRDLADYDLLQAIAVAKADWFRDRHQRWPLTANPYLLVSPSPPWS
ncbi:hypothetical protein [Streptomyces sp. NPDC050988]|uniref:hypothetical protein n=1 Tax=Streptomyces sp. NPDC050988 TaxID=3365637 RepID=UPI00379AB0F3